MSDSEDPVLRHLDRDAFLKKIDYPDHEIYRDIDRFFVPPIEFDAIEKKLREKHVIFLLGPHGSGKTFMAVFLLWKLFREGIDPVWVRWGMIDEDQVRMQLLANPLSMLEGNTCTYIEDPFGKVQYGWGVLFDKHQLMDLVDFFARGFDAGKKTYLILTSSLDVYKEFEASLWPEEFAFLQEKAHFFSINYREVDFREILNRWGEHFSCPWMKSDVITNKVFESLHDRVADLTPLKLKDIAYFSRQAADISVPISLFNSTADNPVGVAVNGISRLPWLQKAFLARFFISPLISQKTFKNYLNTYSASFYNFLFKPSKPQVDSIDELVDEFKDVLINKFGNDTLELTSPGHFEVLSALLKRDPEFANIFHNWLSLLFQNKIGLPNLFWTMIRHYPDLKSKAQKMILKFNLNGNEGDCDDLAIPILFNYQHLPSNIRDLLLPLVNAMPPRSAGRDALSSYQLCLALDRAFLDLPSTVREAIILALQDKRGASEIGWMLVYYHELLSPALQQLPFKLITDHEIGPHVAFGIGYLFHKIPKEMQALAWDAAKGEDIVQRMLASGLFRNLRRLTAEAYTLLVELAQRNMLGLTFSRWKEWINNSPSDLDAFLKRVAQEPKAIPEVANFIINNYSSLPESTRSLLFELLNPEKLQKIIGEIATKASKSKLYPDTIYFAYNIYFRVGREILGRAKDLPREVLGILLDLADLPEMPRTGTFFNDPGFSNLPVDLRDKLIEKFAIRENPPGMIASSDEFRKYFMDSSPEKQIVLLENLIKKEDFIQISKFFVQNYETLSSAIISKLTTLIKSERARYFFCNEVLRRSSPPLPQELIDLFLEIGDTPEMLPRLGSLIVENYEKLPTSIQDLAPRISIRDKDGKPSYHLAETIVEHYERLPAFVQSLLDSIEQAYPDECAVGILRSYTFAPPAIQARLPGLFESASNVSRLAYELSRAICGGRRAEEREREREKDDIERQRRVTITSPPSDIRKSEKRLEQEARMKEMHEGFEKRHQESEKQHALFSKKHQPLPKKLENHLLEILISRGPSEGLASLLVDNFSVLDSSRTGLLFTWVKDAISAGFVAKKIGLIYDKAPESLKQLLRDMIMQPVFDSGVVAALVYAYEKLPPEVQQQIFKFAEHDLMKGEVAFRIAHHSKRIPDNIVGLLTSLQDELLKRIQVEFKEEGGSGWRMLSSFIFEETRVSEVRNKVLNLFKEVTDEKVKQWLQLVEKRYKRMASSDALTQDESNTTWNGKDMDNYSQQ